MSIFNRASGQLGDQDFKEMIENYLSWVYICANRNSTRVAAVPLRLYMVTSGRKPKSILLKDQTRVVSPECLEYLHSKPNLTEWTSKAMEIREVTEHPLLTLLRNINNFRNQFDFFEETEIFLELTGNAYWYVISEGFGGLPSEIRILPSQDMGIVPHPTEFISGYFRRMGMEKIPYLENEIIHFRFPNPRDQYYGLSPLLAISESVEYNKKVHILENALLDNRGMNEGVLVVEDTLTDTEFKRLREEWKNMYGGYSKAGRTAILEKGVTYQSLALPPKEMNFLQGRKYTREEIAGAYGVPISMLTSENVNKSNALAGREQHARDAIEPRVIRIEQKLNEKLTPRYDEDLFLAFDTPVPQDKELRIKERESNLRSMYSSVNLEREQDRKEPVPWGKEPFLPAGVMPMSIATAPPAPVPTPAPAPSEEEIAAFSAKIAEQVKQQMRIVA